MSFRHTMLQQIDKAVLYGLNRRVPDSLEASVATAPTTIRTQRVEACRARTRNSRSTMRHWLPMARLGLRLTNRV